MRVAILIQGEPRFCKEFDLFLERLHGFEEVDWFMYLWDQSPSTSNLCAGCGHIVVSPFWRNITKESALEKFQEYLPSNHRVIALELGDQNSVVHEPVIVNYATETIQENVWKMWYSQYQANQLRVKHEEQNNFKYDIVIRTRPDVGLSGGLNLQYVKERLDTHHDLILMPGNHACGYGVWCCDLFGIGSSANMTTYCDIYNQALSHHAAGVRFHPETMLSHHLTRNNLRYEVGQFNLEFRKLGMWEELSTGERFDSYSVKKWQGHIYISNFGRWV